MIGVIYTFGEKKCGYDDTKVAPIRGPKPRRVIFIPSSIHKSIEGVKGVLILAMLAVLAGFLLNALVVAFNVTGILATIIVFLPPIIGFVVAIKAFDII